MFRKASFMSAVIILVLTIASPGISFADDQIPQTAINKILDHKISLQLSDSQCKKLDIINRVIIDKMIQTRAQAEIRKTEIDKFTSNWTVMNSTAVGYNIKEYYQFLAELKSLELEAIMKAKAVLTHDQLKRYSDLADIESMMIKVDAQLADAY
jgi:hypothetical protein